MTETLRVAWLTTGRGPGSFGALDYAVQAMEHGAPFKIAVLFVNRERGEFEATDGLIAFAESKGIPVETLSSVKFRKAAGGTRSKPGEGLPAWRFDYDREVAARLAKYEFDIGVMFGYMLIATPELFDRYLFLNDHPALPDGPVGTYQEVICELIQTGARESGCMMNIVTGDVDRGAAVSFCRFPIRDAANEAAWQEWLSVPSQEPGETTLFGDIRARGVLRERPFVVATLAAIAAGKVAVPGPKPVDLSAIVEDLVTAGGA
jgi:phosphoribosylglycinamide formyltransferase 1